ncbi:MAG: outer membrane lipoprotein carrier protein LolA [Candidatus Hydrogenedentes bacterium]|nr:outer membrane lipoprotein carrier protein LolA [Candidatus Hydrogenedentota bacterium]
MNILTNLSQNLMRTSVSEKINGVILGVLIVFFCPSKLFSSELDSFYTKYKEIRSNTQVLVGEFIQKNIYPDEIYTTFGKVIYVKPDRLVFSTEEPKKITLLDGKRVYEYEPEIKQVAIYDIADQAEIEIFYFAFMEDIEKLKKKYIVSPIVVEDERGRDGLSIKPLTENQKDALFKEIVIQIRKDNFLPYRIRILGVDDVQTVVDFEKVETNCKIRLEDTQIYLSSGTSVVLNDKMVETVGEGGKYIPEPANIPNNFILSREKGEDSQKGDMGNRIDSLISEKDLSPPQSLGK